MSSPGTLVLGATGFIGRWYVLELLTRGEHVAVGLRGGAARDGELRSWLTARGAAPDAVAERLTTVAADITRPGLALPTADAHRLEGVRDVVNLAARYAFGLTRDEARAANVDGAIHPCTGPLAARAAAAGPPLRLPGRPQRRTAPSPARRRRRPPLPRAGRLRGVQDGGRHRRAHPRTTAGRAADGGQPRRRDRALPHR
ncbi:SDR family oxidoreductase [Kitasatospora arboriphila]